MNADVDYSCLISTEAYIVQAESKNGKIYERFSHPFLDRDKAEQELERLQKQFRYHKLWVATVKL
jgi:hypothetical protein